MGEMGQITAGDQGVEALIHGSDRAGIGRRFATWLRRPVVEAAAALPVAGDPARRCYERIGDFLFGHQLGLTPLNFGCAHDYVVGADLVLERAVAQALLDGDAITDGWVERFFDEQPGNALTADILADMAREIEAELAGCIALLDRSQGTVADYGRALEAEIGDDPGTAPRLHRLLGLTQGMIAEARQTEAELRRSRQRKQVLSHNLRKAREAAEVDHLTGLPNRRAFEGQYRRATAGRVADAPPLVVAVCDLDHFKRVNDEHGHDAGDRVLQFVGSSLRAFAGPRRFVARLGGEEFAILFEGHDLAGARDAVESFREPLARRMLFDKETRLRIGHVTLSSGLAEAAPADTPREAVKRADRALYEAKRLGRNRTEIAATA